MEQTEVVDLRGQKRTQRILVVDDTQHNRDLLETLLVVEGYEVSTAKDGLAAIDFIEKSPPDLVLLDVMMPKMNGYEVCRWIKTNEATMLTPVVMITALNTLEDKLQSIEAGADDFLTKPFNKFELKARIRALTRVKQYVDELERAETVICSLALTVEAKDPYTEGHCERLSNYSAALGLRLGLNREEIRALRLGGVLHDLGKIAIPDAILLKPARLTEEEWVIMRRHPEIGERICEPMKSLKLVLPIIRHHHERWNGEGYPDGLKGHEIPVTARVLQIADIYDALATKRPYKRALSKAEAIQTMREEVEKGWWDGELLEMFAGLMMAGDGQ
ncbi:MAG: response regulator [Acidobacteria bacterium]|nr:response regulator [Acidobacteriota bacterium]MBI3656603.1 response regulator [Acidobacteriota bacterium]